MNVKCSQKIKVNSSNFTEDIRDTRNPSEDAFTRVFNRIDELETNIGTKSPIINTDVDNFKEGQINLKKVGGEILVRNRADDGKDISISGVDISTSADIGSDPDSEDKVPSVKTVYSISSKIIVSDNDTKPEPANIGDLFFVKTGTSITNKYIYIDNAKWVSL